MSASSTTSRLIPSISFSGAGFLGCYHLGVAECLIKHGLLAGEATEESSSSSSSSSSPKQILCGSSAGSMVACSVAAGVSTEDGMNVVLEVAKRTRDKTGIMNCLKPGFSLIDETEDLIHSSILTATNNDNEYLLRRLQTYRPRIALTHPQTAFRSPRHDQLNAYRYIDRFDDCDDIVAACLLSSFIPGLTGPRRGIHDPDNDSVKRAATTIRRLAKQNRIRHGMTDEVVDYDNEFEETKGGDDSSVWNVYWDGGICNMWPIVDESTLIVSPLNGVFSPNPFVAPQLDEEYQTMSTEEEVEKETNDVLLLDRLKRTFVMPSKMLKINPYASMGINTRNLETLWRMTMNSTEQVLEQRFRDGHDDARRYLDENNLLQVHTI